MDITALIMAWIPLFVALVIVLDDRMVQNQKRG